MKTRGKALQDNTDTQPSKYKNVKISVNKSNGQLFVKPEDRLKSKSFIKTVKRRVGEKIG